MSSYIVLTLHDFLGADRLLERSLYFSANGLVRVSFVSKVDRHWVTTVVLRGSATLLLPMYADSRDPTLAFDEYSIREADEAYRQRGLSLTRAGYSREVGMSMPNLPDR